MKFDKKYKLCYLKNGKAYFTKKNLQDQWGDDWDDAPYEHNSGEPYCENEGDIIKLYFESCCYREPDDEVRGLAYSVEDINNKKMAWLMPIHKEKEVKPIYAGCSINEFIDTILRTKGEVYLSLSGSLKEHVN